MPRARNAAPQRDDNHVLTEEDFEALQHHFEIKIGTAEAEAAEAAAVAKSKKKAVGNLFKMATAELGYTRDKFETYLIDKRRSPEEFEANEALRKKMYARGGLVPGEQGQLNLGDSADDEARALRDGFEAGKAARDPVPPDYISPIFHPRWMEQWHEGQATNARLLSRAEAILAEREKPKAEPEADDEEQDPADVEADLAKAARELRNSGFMDTAAPADEDASEMEPA